MKTKLASVLLSVAALALTACGEKPSEVNTGKPTDPVQESGGFDYENPDVSNITIPVFTQPEDTTPERVSGFEGLDVPVMATIEADGLYVVEAEDLDLSGATMQDLCDHFYESTPLASGGMCIACVGSPTILAFKFELKAAATVDFSVLCAKYENPFDLDANVQMHVDEEPAFVSGYTDFGPAEGNQWYNFKDVPLGSLALAEGEHTFYIETVGGTFPNTDCYHLTVSNYGA